MPKIKIHKGKTVTTLIIYLCLFFIYPTQVNSLESKNYPLNRLRDHADGLNIEGGIIPLLKLKPTQRWVNLGVVLDRPFEDGIEYSEWAEKNAYPLKETSLPSYNEAYVNYVYATVLKYYIDHAHNLSNKPNEQLAKIIVHIHRGKSGPAHIELLTKILTDCFPNLKSETVKNKSKDNSALVTYHYANNTEIEFRYGSGFIPEVCGIFDDADIVISLSLVAGFNPKLNSGDIVIPKTFIPMPLSLMQMRKDLAYTVDNHLLEIMPDLIKKQDSNALNIINQKFRSTNPAKFNQVARQLTVTDFYPSTIVQVDNLFNPKSLPKILQIIE